MSDSPDMIEIAPNNFVVKIFLKLLAIKAIVISQMNNPTKIAKLYKIIWSIS